jgi:pimeloyl-ACP methyl ester carboxylesterase
MRRHVVLVPGLWMPAAAMASLSRALRAYEPRVFAYRGRDCHEQNVEALARFAGDGACLVGHSLGGVLIYDMLARHPEVSVEAAVLLGAPVRGCLAGRRFGRRALGRWMMGACCSLWSERDARWQRSAPLGVVAGTRPVGLGRMFGALPGPNDGVVCVEETTVDGMAERALVRQGHSMLIVSPSVSALVARFVARGAFA